ncbi:hypothetical protein NS365_09045 [Aureimonas ureilytica]|uniref:Uncharacterized protein n=1 Tax=Aureimonas ureilytica TaxID=401562 RepID=A0A175RR33_9HYPH|nr:hypothetical protein NS365_09045 [Aureimonas ureilytica]
MFCFPDDKAPLAGQSAQFKSFMLENLAVFVGVLAESDGFSPLCPCLVANSFASIENAGGDQR